MTRVLFVGEAITLAHVARPLALASLLDPGEFQVGHAWDSRYDELSGRPPDIPLWTIPAPQFDTALHRGTPIYGYRDLIRYVTDDLAAIERFRPLIYLTLGSSGDAKLLPAVLDGLADLPVRVLAATAGAKPPERIPANARVVRWVPGELIMARVRVVIGNGGSPTTYQGLRAGAPVIGVCGNLDQYLNMSLVEQAGAGVLLRSGRLSATLVGDTVRGVLADDAMRDRARELARVIASYDTRSILHETIREAIKG